MPEYAMPSSSHTINSHRFLIGSPLLAILMFCFAFVILRPQTSSHVQPIVSNRPPASSGTTQSPLQTIPYNTRPTLTKLTTATATSDGNTTIMPGSSAADGTKRLETQTQPFIYKLLR